MAKKAELEEAKKINSATENLEKVEAAKKRAIEKNALKTETYIQKFDNQVAKNLHNAMKKSQTTKRKVTVIKRTI